MPDRPYKADPDATAVGPLARLHKALLPLTRSGTVILAGCGLVSAHSLQTAIRVERYLVMVATLGLTAAQAERQADLCARYGDGNPWSERTLAAASAILSEFGRPVDPAEVWALRDARLGRVADLIRSWEVADRMALIRTEYRRRRQARRRRKR